MGKKDSGLIIEEDLSVVKGAGFKEKKKRRSPSYENRRAGLHDKKKELQEGEKRVKRKRPLALKHKRRLIKASTALSALFVAAVSIFVYGFFMGSGIEEASGDYYTVCLERPYDGSTPDEHTGIENVGYMNYVLQQQPYWYSHMTSTINISAVGLNIVQAVDTEKQFYEGVLVSSDISTSSMVNTAKQYCVIKDPPVVLWREAASKDPSTFNGLNTEWDSGEASGMTRQEFRRTRGPVPDEFSVYVINENTVLNYSEVTVNPDGTYSQTFELNPDDTFGEKCAVYYYRYQMQTTGGLTSLPTFHSVEVTYTFDRDWRVLSADITESYDAAMAVISAGGVAVGRIEYSYAEEKAKNSYYEDYFKQYESNFGEPADESVTASGALSAAFGSILTGEAKLSVDLTVNGQPVSGNLLLNLNENDVRVDLGNIKLWLKDEKGASYIYLAYGDKTKLRLSIDDLTGLIGSVAGDGLSLDTDGLLQELMNGEFTVSADGASARLYSELELLGLNIPLNFTFNIAEDKSVTLNAVSTELDIAGLHIAAKLYFTDKEVEALEDTSGFVDINIGETVSSFMSAEALSADIEFAYGDISLSGRVAINLDGFALKADIKAVFGGDIKNAKNISAVCADDRVYLSLGSEGEEPALFKVDIDGAMALIGSFIDVDEIDLSGLLKGIDLGKILGCALADRDFANLFATAQGPRITIKGTELIKYLGADFALGDIVLSLDGGTIGVEALGAKITLSPSERFEFDSSEYDGAADLIAAANKILSIIDDGGVRLHGAEMSLSVEGIALDIKLNELAIKWNDGVELWLDAELYLDGSAHDIMVSYNKSGVALRYDNIVIELKAEDFDDFIDAALKLYNAIAVEADLPAIDNLGEALKSLLPADGISAEKIYEIINGVGISRSERGNLSVTYGKIAAEIAFSNDSSDVLGVNISYGDILTVKNAFVGAYSAPNRQIPSSAYAYHLDGKALLPLINRATKAIQDKGISLSGGIELGVSSVKVAVKIEKLSISWAHGFSLAADIRLAVGSTQHDIYAAYSGGKLIFAYGGVGAEINIEGGDLDILQNALLELYNRIIGVINGVIDDTSDSLKTAESLDELLGDIKDLVGLGGDAAISINSIIKSLTGIDLDGGIAGIINSLNIYCPEGGIIGLSLGGIDLSLYGDESLYMSITTQSLSLSINGLTFENYSEVDVPEAAQSNLLSADDIAEVLDYVAAAVEMLAKSQFDIDLSAQVTTDDEKYSGVDYVKYNIDATFEYVQGESGFPLHLDLGKSVDENGNEIPFAERDDLNFWVAPDMYAHIAVNMNSTLAEVDSVLFDAYIFDGDPAVSGGKTTSGALSTNGVLDIYMSLSRVAANEKDAAGNAIAQEPVKIYAPVDDIMTIIAAGAALLDLGSLEADSQMISGILAGITHAVDTLIIDQWLPDTRDQFASLGSSLINQFVDGGLQSLLNKLTDALDNAEKEAGMPEVSERDGERQGVIDSVKVEKDEGSTVLTIGAADVVFTMNKETYEKGTRITRVAISDVALPAEEGEPRDTLKNLSMDITYEGVIKATNFAGYYDFRGIDDLLNALVNSATHEVDSDEVISGEQTRRNYKLNEVFFINGYIDLTGTLKILFNIDIADLRITIDAVSVTLDENNDIAFNVRLSYPKTSVIVALINDSGTTDISLKNGMVYMKRVSGGKTIYRAMPSSEFGNDILNQIGFILNLGSTITDQFAGTSAGDENTEKIKEDYGTQLATYLKSLSHDPASGLWNIVINGAGLLSNGSISLGDISLSFSADKDAKGGYVIRELNLSTNLNILNGLLKLSVSGKLYYCNPTGVWTGNSVSADPQGVYGNVTESDPGIVTRAALNNMTDREIIEKIDWDRLYAETGGKYIEMIFDTSTGTVTSDMRFKEITVHYYVKSGVDDNAGEIYVTTDSQIALVNNKTNSIYSVLNYPDMSEYERAGYSFIWLDPVYSGGEYTVCARYVKTSLTVTYYSSVEFAASEQVLATGYENGAYARTVSFLSLSYGRPLSIADEEYEFVGWYYGNSDGSWITVTDLRSIENLGHLDSIELHALWMATEFTGNYSFSYKVLWDAHSYSYSLTVRIYCNSNLLDSVGIADLAIKCTTGDGSTSASDTAKPNATKQGNEFKASGSGSFTSIVYTSHKWTIAASFNLTVGGKTVLSCGGDNLTLSGS